MKKQYRKPYTYSAENIQGVIPLAAIGAAAAATTLAPAAALVGGYAVGRGVRQAMEIREGGYTNSLDPIAE